MDRFIDLRDVKSSLELHPYNGQPYLMGVFMVGAYQEILGDLHNLFGDTNAIHVRVENDGYRIDHVVEGDSVTEVLGYVQYDRADLVRRVRRASEEALRARAITFEESALLLRRFEEGLSGYTYLEEEPPGSPAVPRRAPRACPRHRIDAEPHALRMTTTRAAETDRSKLSPALTTELEAALASFEGEAPLAGDKLEASADRLFQAEAWGPLYALAQAALTRAHADAESGDEGRGGEPARQAPALPRACRRGLRRTRTRCSRRWARRTARCPAIPRSRPATPTPSRRGGSARKRSR
jgi:hypothetical protein